MNPLAIDLRTHGYGFVGGISLDRRALRPNHVATLSGRVRNCGKHLGTVYVVLHLADSYTRDALVYDSDADEAARVSLRLVDIAPDEHREFVVQWRVPESVAPGHLDVEAEVWTPSRMYPPQPAHCFDALPWRGALHIAKPPSARFRSTFISYAQHTDEHRRWVMSMGDELILRQVPVVVDYSERPPNRDWSHFMETGAAGSDAIVLVCSRTYVDAVDGLELARGAGFEGAQIRELYRRSRQHKLFVPVLRDGRLASSEAARLPRMLGSLDYVDMDGPDWQGRPLQELMLRLSN